MIDTKALRQKILDMAIRGELVSQNPNDEPASVLLEKIRAEKQRLIKEGKIKKDKVDSVIFKCDDNRHYENLPNGWVEISLFEICWLEDGNQINGEELVYWDAKALRGKNTKVKISYGKIVEQGKNVILVDGENSGEVFTIPYRGYLGSTFKILQIAPLVSQNFVRIILDYNRDLFRENKTGSAIPHLNKRLFKTMNVLLPPFLEQERIAKNVDLLLSQIDIIEQNQTGIETLYDELKKRTLDLAIQGKLVPQDENDEPASVLLEKIRAEKKAKLGKKYVDSNIYKGDDNCYYEKVENNTPVLLENLPFDIPDSWCWARLGNAVSINPRNSIEDDMIISFVEMKSLKDGFNNDFTYEPRYWREVKSGFTHFQDNDVGYAKITPCFQNRKSCVFHHLKNSCGAGTSELHILRAYPNTILSEYLLWFVKSPYFIEYGKQNFSGTAGQQRFGTNEMKNTFVPIPPYREQIRIVAQINSILQIFEKGEA